MKQNYQMDPMTRELCEKYKLDHNEDLYQLHSNMLIKHRALERIAGINKIKLDKPEIIESSIREGYVVLLITGRMEDKEVSSYSSATKLNCKIPYIYEMAEKRGKGRVILKLLNLYGYIYSEDEFDTSDERKVETEKEEIQQNFDEAIMRHLPSVTDRETLIKFFHDATSQETKDAITKRGMELKTSNTSSVAA